MTGASTITGGVPAPTPAVRALRIAHLLELGMRAMEDSRAARRSLGDRLLDRAFHEAMDLADGLGAGK